MTTAEAARDMDVLRAALGEAQLLYFGASYGTKLGATYAELFPDKVGRLVLDGAVDVSLDRKQLDVEQAGGFEVALRSYVQNCVDNGDCFLGDSLDAGLATIQDLIASIEDDPLPSDDGRELSVGNAFYGLVAPLYNEQYWPILDQALAAGARRRRHPADAALRRLHLAQPRRLLRRQQRRGHPTPSTASTTPPPSPPPRSPPTSPTTRPPPRPSAGSSPGAWSAAAASRSSAPSPTP